MSRHSASANSQVSSQAFSQATSPSSGDSSTGTTSGGRALKAVLRVTLRSFRSHLGRLVLTVCAVAVAVSFLTGSQMLSGVLNGTVSTMMSSEYEGVPVVVRPAEGHPSLAPDSATVVGELPEVDRVNINDRRSVLVTAADGTTVDSGKDHIHVVPWYPPEQAVGSSTESGGPGPAPGEALVSEGAARGGLAVGSLVHVNDGSEDYDLTVTGTIPDSDDKSTDTGIELAVNLDDYTARYAESGLPALLVTPAPGAETQETMDAIGAALDSPERGLPDVRTGEELVDESQDATESALGFVRYLLYAFAGVALLAALFTIVNTFQMTVARRNREIALLRSLGVSRRQVTGSVLGEALLCGVVGSGLGVLLGVGAVHVLLRAVRSMSDTVDVSAPEVTGATIVVPLVVGTVVTLLGGVLPARKAGRVAPLEALRQAEAPQQRTSPWRTVAGIAVIIAGAVLCSVALSLDADTTTRASLAGAGAVVGFLGVYLASPAILGAVTGLFNRLPHRRPAVRLATAQVSRTPARSAGTAFALTLGLSLTTVTGMLGASVVNAVEETVTTEVTADLVVGAADGLTVDPVPGTATDAVRETPGVGSVYTVGKAPVVVGAAEDGVNLVSVSNGDPTTAVEVGEVTGNLDLSSGEGLTMSASFAADHGLQIGDLVEVGVPGQTFTSWIPLQGTYGHSRLLGDVVVSSTAFWRLAPGDRGLGGHRTLAVAVTGDGSVDTDTLRERLEDATASSPSVGVQTPAEFAGRQTDLIDRIIAVVYALSALAVIVAVLGVANTLALSVAERRREIGMLRAVGATRGLIRRTITVEAVLTSVYGAVVGVLAGLGAGFAVLGVLGDVGLTSVIVPWAVVAGVLVGSVVVGVVSALAPAVRAARTPPLDAVAE
ncbi:putative membrane protein [Corynebacterium variabile DSM 44702]|uniref:Putative membrane protein n=1 Tax=Corynebacterium variabile (strain DSM 44702 / CIP 107183 / JCM 12073 / NCIMB 30131) TaxID=858619 RepID=G0HCY4_CORVD|nr:FtsX-like permease family protein [Corynebacterium variabile]AEK35948.1 putative membrane protein [Corynebacterium variabile DSM 44702]